MRDKEAIDHICQLLEQGLPVDYHYHNIRHTRDVIEASTLLARMEGLSDHDTALVRTAAAYHDAGFLEVYNGHEEHSIQMMYDILPEYDYSETDLARIATMIRATILPQDAIDLCSKILCDADMDYLGRPDFEDIANMLRQEWAETGKVFTEEAWILLQVNFLRMHRYYTASAKRTRNSGLQQNIEKYNARWQSLTNQPK